MPVKILRKLNNEFQNILKYCNANKFSINMQKTHFMLIRSSKKTITSKIEIQNIIQKQCIKYLGIYLDEKLNCKNQITLIWEYSINCIIIYR